ncbi:hypothetical protein WA026_005027 [Henosepilachna vigintioctopunctata]|uniref:Uncharacterized protein n=1 Tax=Henosepilachna vigintioctopunctata TaxID=420089 RepID=A0AAW1ULY8_9CUCU
MLSNHDLTSIFQLYSSPKKGGKYSFFIELVVDECLFQWHPNSPKIDFVVNHNSKRSVVSNRSKLFQSWYRIISVSQFVGLSREISTTTAGHVFYSDVAKPTADPSNSGDEKHAARKAAASSDRAQLRLSRCQRTIAVPRYAGVECENEIYSAAQLSCVKNLEEQTSTTVIDSSNVILLNESLLIADSPILQEENADVSSISGDSKDSYEYLDEDPLKPKRNTQKILTTRTKDMSRGFLTFTEDSGLTMLKEEPEDLTHLAPVAGDVCVPLEDHPFLSDVLDDLLLRENLNPLMMDTPIDPFISYRDTYDMSPELSPNFSKSSSLPSLNSPSNSLGEDDHMSTFMSYSIEEEGSDSSMRPGSPYIPMNMDDLPLLLSSSNDLMWSNSSSPTPASPSNKPAKDSSSLAQLLSTTVKTSIKSNTASDQIGQSQWNTKTVEKNMRPQSSSPNCNKRTNTTSCNTTNKRMKTEQPKDNTTSELLQQLISNNNGNSRGRPKKANWLLEGQKAACISQPSDSVLMNLLGHTTDTKTQGSNFRKYLIRVNSKSLLNPETAPIASFLTLTDRDYEVNAPVNNRLLQGEDLIKALDIGDTM